MTEPRDVVIRQAELASLTGVEMFTALAQAGLTRARVAEAVAAIQDPDGNPNVALRGLRYVQALALQLRLREGEDATWSDAQGWNVTIDTTETPEEALAAERTEYQVAAAVLTGVPLDQVEALPVGIVDAFATARRRGA